MGVADHTAVDMTRLSNGTKNAMCPGSCVVATSLINDTNFDQWMVQWLKMVTSSKTESQMKKSFPGFLFLKGWKPHPENPNEKREISVPARVFLFFFFCKFRRELVILAET